MKKIYKFHCTVCGAYTERKMTSGKTKRCAACGIQAAIGAAYSMSTHQGPAWDNFTKSRGL